MPFVRRSAYALVCVIAAVFVFASAGTASGAPVPTTFVVDTAGDNTASPPVPPHYDLATAIVAANADPGSTIEFSPSLVNETLGGANSGAESENHGLPAIESPMTIDGCAGRVAPGTKCTPHTTITLTPHYGEAEAYDEHDAQIGNDGQHIFDVLASEVTIKGLELTETGERATPLFQGIDAGSAAATRFTLIDNKIIIDAFEVIRLGADDAKLGGLAPVPSQTLAEGVAENGDGNLISADSVQCPTLVYVEGGEHDSIDGNTIKPLGCGTALSLYGGYGMSIVANKFISGSSHEGGSAYGIEITGSTLGVQIGEPGNVDPQTVESSIAPPNSFSSTGFQGPIWASGAKPNMFTLYQATGAAASESTPFVYFSTEFENYGVTTPTITSATTNAIFGTADEEAEIMVVSVNGPPGNTSSITGIVALGATNSHGNFAIPFQKAVPKGSELAVYEIVPGVGSSQLAGAVTAASPPIASFTSKAPHDIDPATSQRRPVRPGQTVEFDASASHNLANATSEEYVWNWGDGSTTNSGSNPGASHAFANAGTYSVQLVLTDQTPAGPEQSVLTEVLNVAPDVVPVPTIQTPGSGVFGTTIPFEASGAYDPDGSITNYQVSVTDPNGKAVPGDAYNNANPPTTLVVPSVLGTSKATLTVTDDEGATASETVPIKATNPPSPPLTPEPALPEGKAPSSNLDTGQSNLLTAEQNAQTGGQPIPAACGSDQPTLSSCVSSKELSPAIVGESFAAIGGSADLTLDTTAQFVATAVQAGTNGNVQVHYEAPNINMNGIEIEPAAPGQGSLTVTTETTASGSLDYEKLESSGGNYAVTFSGMRLYVGPISWSVFGPGSSTSAPKVGFASEVNNIAGATGFAAQIQDATGSNPATPTLNGLSVASFSPFSFSQGKAFTQVTTQLPSALGQAGAGGKDGELPGPDSPSPVTISNNSIVNAVTAAKSLVESGDGLLGEAPTSLFGGETDPLSVTKANADSAAGDCGTRLKGTLPTGPEAISVGYPSASLGGIPLDGVHLTIDGPNHYILKAEAELPSGNASLTALVEIAKGKFRFACAAAEFPEPGVQLGIPVYLKEIHLGVLNNGVSWAVNGGAKFTAGPEVLGEALLEADIEATAVFPGSTAPPGTPWGFGLAGNVTLLPGLCQSASGSDCGFTASAQFVYVSEGYFRGSLETEMGLGSVVLHGNVTGTVLRSGDWDVNGAISVDYPEIEILPEVNIGPGTVGAGADVHSISKRITASICVHTGITGVGNVGVSFDVKPFKLHWSISCGAGVPSQFVQPTCANLESQIAKLTKEKPAPGTANAKTLGFDQTLVELGPPTACSAPGSSHAIARQAHRRPLILQPGYGSRPVRGTRTAVKADLAATELQPGQVETFEIQSSGAIEAITATGNGAPPAFEVVTPDGAVYTSAQNGVRDLANNTTTLYVNKPADEQAGAWSLVVEEGSPAVVETTTQERMEPKVTGSVQSLGGRTEKLTYSNVIPEGDKVRFTEVGSNSSTVIGTTGGGSGTLEWTIANGSAGERTVEATLLEGESSGGYTNPKVATFTAPGPLLPGPVSNASIQPDGTGGATVSYKPDALTHTVVVAISGSNGISQQYTEPASTTSIDIPSVPGGTKLSAKLTSQDEEERVGGTAEATATIGTAGTGESAPVAPPVFVPAGSGSGGAGNGGGGGGAPSHTSTTSSTGSMTPSITGVRQAKSSWRAGRGLPRQSAVGSSTASLKAPKAGTAFYFALNTRATVQLEFRRTVRGERRSGRCVPAKPSKSGAHKPACSLVRTVATLTYNDAAGSYEVTFAGAVNGHLALSPGTYSLVIVARNSAGGTATHPITFTVLRAKHK